MKRLALCLAVVTTLFGLTAHAFATSTTSAQSATTDMAGGASLVNLINQSGLSIPYTSGVTDFDTYLAGNPNHTSLPGNDWVSLGTPIGKIDFDLGSVLVVDRIAVWNFSGGSTFSTENITIFASQQSDFSGAVNLGTFLLNLPPSNSSQAQVINFGSTNAQFIRFQILGNYGASTSTALGEVAFSTSPTAPSLKLVEIDIKPKSDSNSINSNNLHGVITVAILTTDDFDATTVDHTTISFQGASETHVSKKTGNPKRHEEDVDGDGDTDLVLHFRLGDTDLTCESTEGVLTGEDFDGQAIEGIDDISTVPPSAAPALNPRSKLATTWARMKTQR